MFAVTEGNEAKSEIPVDGVRGLKRATDIAESRTAKGVDDKKGGTRAVWEDEKFSLYVSHCTTTTQPHNKPRQLHQPHKLHQPHRPFKRRETGPVGPWPGRRRDGCPSPPAPRGDMGILQGPR